MIASSIRSSDLETKASFVDVKRFDRTLTNTLDDPTHTDNEFYEKQFFSCARKSIRYVLTYREIG